MGSRGADGWGEREVLNEPRVRCMKREERDRIHVNEHVGIDAM